MPFFPSRQLLRPAAGILTETGQRIARPRFDAKSWAENRRLVERAHHQRAFANGHSRFDLQFHGPGFSSYDDIIAQITANGQANDIYFAKTSVASGIAGYWHANWFEAGNPGAGSAPAASGTGTSYTGSSTTGAMFFANVSTKQRYLLSFGAVSTQAMTLYLCDRLIGVGSLAMTATGSVAAASTVALPRYTTGVPAVVLLETTTAATSTTTAVAAHLLSYTNQAGTTARVGVQNSYATGLPKIGDALLMYLNAADQGVEATATINVDTAATLTMAASLVWYRIYAAIPLPANTWVERDLVLQLAGLPQVFDGAAIALVEQTTAASAATITGMFRTAYE